ncbi:Glyoxalase/Bleomycin resistance protein/Dioxygenase superfamily protein [Epsilonproteobacteria bacterium SCGC AD-308-P11]|jgi:catechol 2,3-dioxygenase-like lactoylglutathione lyase family enzyme|nr:Glyoxalase/Bleomycin resistance protein/Dioxygenase superfamily protein [Epsilonproteobacteria bacterium SCGC AD-308-P11]
MDITLNHTIIPAYDNVKSAKFYERIFGFEFLKVWLDFAVVRVNPTLTLDFRTKEKFSKMHYAFKVTDEQFDEIFARIKEDKVLYGSGPYKLDDAKINHNYDGRGVYFRDENGHVLEILTHDYIID